MSTVTQAIQPSSYIRITARFVVFFGITWVAFAYVAYLIGWRMRRSVNASL